MGNVRVEIVQLVDNNNIYITLQKLKSICF